MKLYRVMAAAAAATMLMNTPVFATDFDTWYQQTSQGISDAIAEEYDEAIANGENWGDMTPEDAYEIAMTDAVANYLYMSGQSTNYSTSSSSSSSKKKTTKTISGYIKSAYWEGKKAKWSYSGNLKQFSITLYRDGKVVTTKKAVNANNMTFYNEMNQPGEYYFKVRGKASDGWTSYEESPEYVVYTASTTANVVQTSGSTVTSAGPTMAQGIWTQAKDGSGRWWYPHANGSYTVNNWEQINNRWYYFDANGWMMTGWLDKNGVKYYLGSDGGMVTGFSTIDNVTHYFTDNGAMLY